MSGRGRQIDDDEPEITAQPKSMPEELAASAGGHEQGLSVDPEDLGRTWLSDATEQGNFESASGGENDEQWLSASGNSDEARPGPNFEVDKDVWENTVSLTLQNGEGAVSDPLIEDEEGDGMHLLEDDEESGDLDLTQTTIHEASLFDHEADELGETEPPAHVVTDDNHTHARHGSVQGRARPRASADAGPSKPTSTGSKSRETKAAAPAKKTLPPKAKAKSPASSKAAAKPKARSSAPRAR